MYRLAVAIILTLIAISSQSLNGQTDGTGRKVFSGKVIDDSLEIALPAVHIWNESTRMGIISNDSGEFIMGVRNQDTIVFSAIGYSSYLLVISSSLNQRVVVRLKPKKYEIAEVVVRRFRNYQSFIYQVVHLDLPDTRTTEMREYIKAVSTVAALEADRERAVENKLETGRLGYITPLGKGIDREKAFREKIDAQKKREQIINAKFNRELVGDITHLEGDELTEFIALCDFSEEYLYETDLYTIMEDLYVLFHDYQNTRDSIQ